MKKKRFDPEKTIYAVVAIACFFVLWWFLTTFTPVKNTTPDPIAVLKLLFESFYTPIGSKVITGHLLVSLRRVLVGFGVATVLGIILGIAMGTSKWASAIFKPIFELLRPIPPIARRNESIRPREAVTSRQGHPDWGHNPFAHRLSPRP